MHPTYPTNCAYVEPKSGPSVCPCLEGFLAQRRPRMTPSEVPGSRVVGLQPARQRRRIDGPAGALRAEERSIASLRSLLRRTTEAGAHTRQLLSST